MKVETQKQQIKCQFCHSEISLVECHGHRHCTNCGMPNEECCTGETTDNWPTLRYDDEKYKVGEILIDIETNVKGENKQEWKTFGKGELDEDLPF